MRPCIPPHYPFLTALLSLCDGLRQADDALCRWCRHLDRNITLVESVPSAHWSDYYSCSQNASILKIEVESWPKLVDPPLAAALLLRRCYSSTKPFFDLPQLRLSRISTNCTWTVRHVGPRRPQANDSGGATHHLRRGRHVELVRDSLLPVPQSVTEEKLQVELGRYAAMQESLPADHVSRCGGDSTMSPCQRSSATMVRCSHLSQRLLDGCLARAVPVPVLPRHDLVRPRLSSSQGPRRSLPSVDANEICSTYQVQVEDLRSDSAAPIDSSSPEGYRYQSPSSSSTDDCLQSSVSYPFSPSYPVST
jgi:hypothetical protein